MLKRVRAGALLIKDPVSPIAMSKAGQVGKVVHTYELQDGKRGYSLRFKDGSHICYHEDELEDCNETV